MPLRIVVNVLLLTAVICGFTVPGRAEVELFRITIKDHVFIPPEIEVPAGKKVRLIVKNEDPTPEEFESYDLNREKVVTGNGTITLFIGPLQPGEYTYFGEFHPETAQGIIKAVETE